MHVDRFGAECFVESRRDEGVTPQRCDRRATKYSAEQAASSRRRAYSDRLLGIRLRRICCVRLRRAARRRPSGKARQAPRGSGLSIRRVRLRPSRPSSWVGKAETPERDHFMARPEHPRFRLEASSQRIFGPRFPARPDCFTRNSSVKQRARRHAQNRCSTQNSPDETSRGLRQPGGFGSANILARPIGSLRQQPLVKRPRDL